MGNKITILDTFVKEGLGNIRVAKLNGEPLFNLYDTCFDLGYTTKNSKGTLYLYKSRIEDVCKSLDITGVDTVSTEYMVITKETDFENTWITEPNFYDLCLESKAKNARPFRKWVTSEVLPSVRKTGSYSENKIDEIEKLKLEQSQLEFVLNRMHLSKSSEIKVITDFNESQGLSTAYLPSYVDEEAGTAPTQLLTEFKVPLSTVKFNKLLIEKGYLEEMKRKSTNEKGFKTYKVLTEKGLQYGKNEVNTKGSSKDSQPLYFKNKFQELLDLIITDVEGN